jgi:hypothetical protein
VYSRVRLEEEDGWIADMQVLGPVSLSGYAGFPTFRQNIEVTNWQPPIYQGFFARLPTFAVVALVLLGAAMVGLVGYKCYAWRRQENLKRSVLRTTVIPNLSVYAPSSLAEVELSTASLRSGTGTQLPLPPPSPARTAWSFASATFTPRAVAMPTSVSRISPARVPTGIGSPRPSDPVVMTSGRRGVSPLRTVAATFLSDAPHESAGEDMQEPNVDVDRMYAPL